MAETPVARGSRRSYFATTLILCRVTPPVHIVLELTRLDQVLQISSGSFNSLDIYPA